jgi:hypothetical protein
LYVPIPKLVLITGGVVVLVVPLAVTSIRRARAAKTKHFLLILLYHRLFG